jgi:hypothetical protein
VHSKSIGPIAMSMLFTVSAALEVEIEVAAATPEQGLAQARAALKCCRVVPASFWRRSWLHRLLARSMPKASLPVAGVTAARIVSGVYAGGE